MCVCVSFPISYHLFISLDSSAHRSCKNFVCVSSATMIKHTKPFLSNQLPKWIAMDGKMQEQGGVGFVTLRFVVGTWYNNSRAWWVLFLHSHTTTETEGVLLILSWVLGFGGWLVF